MKRTPRLRLATQMFVLTSLLVAVVVSLCTVVAVVTLRRDLTAQYEQRALAVARSVAESPGLGAEVESGRPSPSSEVQRDAERVRIATGALYVVVADVDGVRFSHPNTAEIGHRVSTSPAQALGGHDQATIQSGTLGRSARGKVPLRDTDGTIVGEVSVGIGMGAVDHATWVLALGLGALSLLPFALGLAGAITMGRRLRRSTFGLEPAQMADLVREHEAVLYGVTDAVLAVDPGGRVTVVNPEAERLLGRSVGRGQILTSADVEQTVVDLMTQDPAPKGELRLVAGRAVLARRLPVRRDGRDLGQVLIMRDRSDLDSLGQELEATRALSDALRAQSHDFSNRLHTLIGLLHHNDVDEARAYLDELACSHTWVSGVDDPYLAGLLAAKSAVASESGVALSITPETFVQGRLSAPLDAVTVIGNLIDNAIRASAGAQRRPPRVEVTLLSDGHDLVVHVRDTGDGVPPEETEKIFDHGWSSQASSKSSSSGHGLGLSLARHTALRGGGDIVLVDSGGPPPGPSGAAFEARLEGVVGRRRADGSDQVPAAALEGDAAVPEVHR